MRTTLSALLLLAVATPAVAWEVPTNGYGLLRDLQRSSTFAVTRDRMTQVAQQAGAQGYIIGFAESLDIRSTGEVTYADVWAVVRAFLEQNPERLSEPPKTLVRVVLTARLQVDRSAARL